MITIKDIAPSFCFLEDKGYIPIKKYYEPDSFGNALIILAGKDLSIKLVRDRSQVFVDIGKIKEEKWYKLEDILQFIDASITEDELGSPPDIEILAKLSRERWQPIINLFNSKESLGNFEAHVKEKTTSLLRKIFNLNNFKSDV